MNTTLWMVGNTAREPRHGDSGRLAPAPRRAYHRAMSDSLVGGRTSKWVYALASLSYLAIYLG
ncbi:MAG TPA: hypothetical protein VHG32_03660, partial [Thermoanaerobaculia bacterium]|nr:hypothetical protein [Thermoanaerobaculia bacterium]